MPSSVIEQPTNGGLKGIIPPVQTPTLEAESAGARSINLDMVENLYAHLVQNGADGVFVAGGVGRGAALNLDQTQSLVTRWLEVRHADGKDGDSFPIVINVGRPEMEESKAFAEMANQLNVDGMFWFPSANPDSADTAIDHMAAAVRKAPGIPIYWYHIPSVTGTFEGWTARDLSEFISQATDSLSAQGGTFGGLKCTVPDTDLIAELARQSPEFLILGYEATVMDGFSNGGGRAVVNLTASFSAKPYHDLLAAIGGGDMDTARRVQGRMDRFLNETFEGSKGDLKLLVENGHHLMTLAGVPVGNMFDGDVWDQARLDDLHRRAAAFGFADFTGVSLPPAP